MGKPNKRLMNKLAKAKIKEIAAYASAKADRIRDKDHLEKMYGRRFRTPGRARRYDRRHADYLRPVSV